MKNLSVVDFLYRTVLGRILLKLLVRLEISDMASRYLSGSASKWMIPYFIRKHQIDMSDIAIPTGGFSSFNDFFIRKRKNLFYNLTFGRVISPCDGLLTIKKIKGNAVFDIKHSKFSLEDLVADTELAAKYRDGTMLIFRLTPENYHRYCYAVDGKVLSFKKIRGVLHCVRPIALRTVPVFAQNSREYEVIKTDRFGTAVQMEVGALLVGRIKNYRRNTETGFVWAGDEKGYFEFGGSTIIVLLEKKEIRFNELLYQRQNDAGEIPVRMGDFIACLETGSRL